MATKIKAPKFNAKQAREDGGKFADRYMTRNIIGIYLTADPLSVEYGIDWYEKAHALACDMAQTAHVSIECAAGVIAAMSPQTKWSDPKPGRSDNIRAAWAMLGFNRITGKVVQTTDNLAKAANIAKGADPELALRKNPDDPNAALKTRNFYRLIADPSCDAVCIDTHAMDIAEGFIGAHAHGPTPSLYRKYAAAYVAAGRELGVKPSIVQAVTWEAWRRAKLAEGGTAAGRNHRKAQAAGSFAPGMSDD